MIPAGENAFRLQSVSTHAHPGISANKGVASVRSSSLGWKSNPSYAGRKSSHH
jgi:hypothetical protein